MEERREAALACFDNLSEEQKDKAWEDFEAMDLDGNGTITLSEYQQFYYGSSYRIPFQELDTNRNGKLNFQEFKPLFYLLHNSRSTTPLIPTQDQRERDGRETGEAALACFDNLSEELKDKAWEEFEAMDLDGDGTITLIEYQQFYYGSSYRIPFQELNTNRDGKLNFQQFKTLFYLSHHSRSTTPLIPTQDQPNSSQSNTRTIGLSEAILAFTYLKDSLFALLTCLLLGLGICYQVSLSREVVMKAIEDFNSVWAFASVVASVASRLYDYVINIL